MISKDDVKARIIRKLVQWRKWGGSHTENILNGLPRHIRGEREVKDGIGELVRDEWIIPVKKTGEIHYSLNPEKADEILQFHDAHSKNR